MPPKKRRLSASATQIAAQAALEAKYETLLHEATAHNTALRLENANLTRKLLRADLAARFYSRRLVESECDNSRLRGHLARIETLLSSSLGPPSAPPPAQTKPRATRENAERYLAFLRRVVYEHKASDAAREEGMAKFKAFLTVLERRSKESPWQRKEGMGRLKEEFWRIFRGEERWVEIAEGLLAFLSIEDGAEVQGWCWEGVKEVRREGKERLRSIGLGDEEMAREMKDMGQTEAEGVEESRGGRKWEGEGRGDGGERTG